MKLAQPHLDREQAKNNKQRWQIFQIVAILILSLIAIGLLEKNDFLTRQNTQLKKQTEQSYSNGKQEVYQEMKTECELLQAGDDKWYECQENFTNY